MVVTETFLCVSRSKIILSTWLFILVTIEKHKRNKVWSRPCLVRPSCDSRVNLTWAGSPLTQVTFQQGAEPYEPPHGSVGDVPAHRASAGHPLWLCLHLPTHFFKLLIFLGFYDEFTVNYWSWKYLWLTRVRWEELGWVHVQVKVLRKAVQEMPER